MTRVNAMRLAREYGKNHGISVTGVYNTIKRGIENRELPSRITVGEGGGRRYLVNIKTTTEFLDKAYALRFYRHESNGNMTEQMPTQIPVPNHASPTSDEVVTAFPELGLYTPEQVQHMVDFFKGALMAQKRQWDNVHDKWGIAYEAELYTIVTRGKRDSDYYVERANELVQSMSNS